MIDWKALAQVPIRINHNYGEKFMIEQRSFSKSMQRQSILHQPIRVEREWLEIACMAPSCSETDELHLCDYLIIGGISDDFNIVI